VLVPGDQQSDVVGYRGTLRRRKADTDLGDSGVEDDVELG